MKYIKLMLSYIILPLFVFLIIIFSVGFNDGLYDYLASMNADAAHTVQLSAERRIVFQYLLNYQGLPQGVFSERELRHLTDIKKIVQTLGWFTALIATLSLLGWCALWRSFTTGTIKKMLRRVSVVVFIGTTSLLLAALFIFDATFITMHRVLFYNNDWQLDPTYETLILAFPPELFQRLGLLMFTLLDLLSLLAFIFSFWPFKFVVKNDMLKE